MDPKILDLIKETFCHILGIELIASENSTSFALNQALSSTQVMSLEFPLCSRSLPVADIPAGKLAVVCGYGDVGMGCVAALKRAGARVILCAPQTPEVLCVAAPPGGHEVVLTLEEVISVGDIFITTIGNQNRVITVEHMRKMKDGAVLLNMTDSYEIDMNGLQNLPGVQRISVNPQTVKWIFPDTCSSILVLAEGRRLNLDFFIPSSFPNQLIEGIDLIEFWPEEVGMTSPIQTRETMVKQDIQEVEMMEAGVAAMKMKLSHEKDEIENWKAAMEDIESELNPLKASIRRMSEETRLMSEAVDELVAMVLDEIN